MEPLSLPVYLKENLCTLSPVHNSAIHLCTGAFRISRVESLYAESGEPALATCRQISLCSYATKQSTLKKCLSYGAVHQPSLQGRFALSLKASCPTGIRYKQLLGLIHIVTPPIIPLKISTIPPWVIVRPCCDTHFCNLPKVCTPPHTFYRLYTGFSHTVRITH
jgi:hypothetical protein